MNIILRSRIIKMDLLKCLHRLPESSKTLLWKAHLNLDCRATVVPLIVCVHRYALSGQQSSNLEDWVCQVCRTLATFDWMWPDRCLMESARSGKHTARFIPSPFLMILPKNPSLGAASRGTCLQKESLQENTQSTKLISRSCLSRGVLWRASGHVMWVYRKSENG